MIAVPLPKAFTMPPETEATLLFELDQETVLSVALPGSTVAVSVNEAPGSSESEVWFKTILVTSTFWSSFWVHETVVQTEYRTIGTRNKAKINFLIMSVGKDNNNQSPPINFFTSLNIPYGM